MVTEQSVSGGKRQEGQQALSAALALAVWWEALGGEQVR
jgi:hypothetical protein